MNEPLKRKPSLRTQQRRLEAEKAKKSAAARMRIKLERERKIIARPTRRCLLYAVAAEFGVDAERIESPRRFGRLVRSRAAFAVLARDKFGASTTQIGRTLCRDHTTVGHALNNLVPRLSQDQDFAARLVRIEAALWPMSPTEIRRCDA